MISVTLCGIMVFNDEVMDHFITNRLNNCELAN